MRDKSASSLFPCLNIRYTKDACWRVGTTYAEQKGVAMKETMEPQEAIGIIGAMDEEIDPLLEAAQIKSRRVVAGMEYCEGMLEGKPVVIVKCGMGKVNAGVCANTIINDFNCAKVINAGAAGSLDNQIDIGDVVVSVDAVQHDFDVSAIGFKKGEIPFTGLYAFPADEAMRKAAVEAVREAAPEVGVFEGRACSGDQFITTNEQKERITSNFGGMCSEMEGAAIAQVCHLNDIPFVIIRAISDKADGSQAMEFDAFKAEAGARSARVVLRMVQNL